MLLPGRFIAWRFSYEYIWFELNSQICTLRPLTDIYALVRDNNNIQLFLIEYKNGLTRTYSTNDRYKQLLDAQRSYLMIVWNIIVGIHSWLHCLMLYVHAAIRMCMCVFRVRHAANVWCHLVIRWTKRRKQACSDWSYMSINIRWNVSKYLIDSTPIYLIVDWTIAWHKM